MAERRLLHLRAPPGLDTASLLSRERFEAALLEGRLPPASLVVFGGYRRFDRPELGQRLTPEQLIQLAQQKSTIVAGDLDRVVPELWDLAREAEQSLGDLIRIAGVLSHREETGLTRHFDAASLIIVQIAGEKRWSFFGEPVVQSCRPKQGLTPAERALPASDERVMRPGDLMFVPSGLCHLCAPGGESLHLAIQICHASGRALLSGARQAMLGDERFFAPLPRFAAGEDADALAEDYKARLLAAIAALDARALFANEPRGAAFEAGVAPDQD